MASPTIPKTSAMTDAPTPAARKPPLRTLAIVGAAIVAVSAAPIITLSHFGLSAEMFADDGDQTLRAAGYAFSIWGLIYLGLLAFAVWQALPKTPETPALAAVGWPSMLAMTGCAAWLVAAALDAKLATVAIIVVAALAAISGLLKAAPLKSGLGVAGQRLVFWPLGMLAGWLTIASAINLLTVLTAYGVITGATAAAWATFGIAGVVVIALGVLWRLRHLAYGLPIAWGLAAVWVAERSAKPPVALAAAIGAAIVLTASLAAGIRKRT
jgi:hypothetical protein